MRRLRNKIEQARTTMLDDAIKARTKPVISIPRRMITLILKFRRRKWIVSNPKGKTRSRPRLTVNLEFHRSPRSIWKSLARNRAWHHQRPVSAILPVACCRWRQHASAAKTASFLELPGLSDPRLRNARLYARASCSVVYDVVQHVVGALLRPTLIRG